MPENKKINRKLSAILSADVKGYSVLMADDEVHTIETLKAYRQIISNLVSEHSGRVVDSPGDNILAEFRSSVDAVGCAVEIQKDLQQRNADLPTDKRLEFRIGVNIGDVIQEGDRIYGNGVNVAARIEGLAETGGICISRNAYSHVRDKLELGYEYLGEHDVKNIKRPIRVYKVLMDPEDAGKLIGEKKKISKLKLALMAIAAFLVIIGGISGAIYWKFFHLPTPTDIDPESKIAFELSKMPTIAVLPFDNMTGNPEQDIFCDGFADNLISTLSYTKELLVIARNSSFAYRGKQTNIKQIGKQLNVEWIIEGSVQQAKENIRVTIQLINAESEHHKWSKTYDREFKDIFKIQDEIAQDVGKVIGIELVWGEAAANAYEGIKSIQEYKMLSEAVSNITLGTPESFHRARKQLFELLDMNQSIPFVYTLLSSTYIYDIWLDKCESLAVCIGKAFAHLKKALTLNENYDFAYMAAGELYNLIGDTDKAFNSVRKAINLNPSNAIAYNLLGDCLIYHNKLDEAVASIEKAMDLSPRPNYLFTFTLGFAYQMMREFEKAIDIYNKSIDLNPDFWSTYIGLVICYGHMEDIENANKAIDELFRINPTFKANSFIKTMPWKYESSRDLIRDGILKAGLKIED